jgi:succinate dehydrogenase / fumarate reductase cytochrome b subunit
MADMNRGNRPLSPHLQIFKPHVPMVTSILTRITGNALLVGALLIVWWLLAAATGPEAYAVANGVVTSWFGRLVLVGSLWALYYHGLAGVRHLVWDMGYGLDIETAEKLGIGVIAGSVVLTALTVIALL